MAVALLVEAAPEIESAVSEAAPAVEEFLSTEGSQLAEEAGQALEAAKPVAEQVGTDAGQLANSAESKFQEIASQLPEQIGLVYRNGGNTPANFTPDPIKDVATALGEGHLPGLSTFNSVENLMNANPQLSPGTNVQVLDPSRLQGTGLSAFFDNSPLGHVTIAPSTYQETVDWASTRATALINKSIELAHEFTQAVMNTRISSIKIPN